MLVSELRPAAFSVAAQELLEKLGAEGIGNAT
jgi:hypothetical protein